MAVEDSAYRKREELLFQTIRNVTSLLVALIITMGLVVYYRDSNGYYYQREVGAIR
ncbi:unnamed protein product, partial [Heligmosomoides polygyrus]|uniref:GOLD domain-containing protein n=1 Tax=Heligmosomoides polygyrus TaxID=6339 RepID=A0A183FAY8_HELPZ